jgi:hypothetical protein
MLDAVCINLCAIRTRGARGDLKLPRTLRLRGEMRYSAPRTRSRTRVCKNQKISLHFSRASSPHPSAAKRKKKWKGNFWFCFAVSVSEKSNLYFNIFVCSFLRPHGDRGASCYPRLVVIRNSVPLTANSDKSSKWSLAIQNSLRNGKAQILYVFALPSQRTHPPCRF